MVTTRIVSIPQRVRFGTDPSPRLELRRTLYRSQLFATLAFVASCGADDSSEEYVPIEAPSFDFGQPAPIDDANELVDYVAQCESVLGKIPQISCDPEHPAPGTHVTKIPVFLGGRLLGFDGPEDDEELFAARSADSHYECDFPSMGGDFPCTVGSTLVHYEDAENPNVQWVGLCRGVQHDNPGYDRFIGNGLIGANSQTGEMCFFFGKNPEPEAPYELPRLTSDAESSDALEPWLPPREMPGSCLSCHPNNDPWVLTPWLQPSYMRTVLENPQYPLQLPENVVLEDVLAARFIRSTDPASKTLLPEQPPEGRSAWTEEEIFGDDGRLLHRQYRAVGSSYVDNEAKGFTPVRTGTRPESWQLGFRDRLLLVPNETSCARGCHAVGNEHFTKLAMDSLGMQSASHYLSPMMAADMVPGTGWMPPFAGGGDTFLEMFGQGEPTVPAITECPIPKRLEAEPEVEVHCDPAEPGAGYVSIDWNYVNDFGRVPGRDDIRFEVAFGDSRHMVSELGLAPNNDVEGVAMISDDENISILHDVASTNGDAHYSVLIPFDATGADEMAIQVQPKRFCFEEPDRRPFAYAQPSRLLAETTAACR